MMTETNPMPSLTSTVIGNGRFQWDFFGWFGSTIGGTAWMIIATISLMASNQRLFAFLPFISFVIVNSAAIYMWMQRTRLAPFQALIRLMILVGIAISVVCGSMSLFASKDVLKLLHWPSSVTTQFAVHLMVPVILIWFCFLENRHVAMRSREQAASDLTR